MKKLLLILTIFILITNSAFCSETYRVKNKYGQYQGKYVRIDNTTLKRYNSYNQYSGKIVNKNNTIKVYDKYNRLEYGAE